MTCVYKEYGSKIKNGTGSMTTAKMKFLLGYNLKIVIQWGQWTSGGGSLQGGFWLVWGGGGWTSFHPQSREDPV